MVSGACWFVVFLDAVAVVPGAFDCAWAGPMSAFADEQLRDFGQVLLVGVIPVLRGECPPYR